MRSIKAGFVGFGEINTPKQIIDEKCMKAQKLLESQSIELAATAPVTDDPEGKDAARAKEELSREPEMHWRHSRTGTMGRAVFSLDTQLKGATYCGGGPGGQAWRS